MEKELNEKEHYVVIGDCKIPISEEVEKELLKNINRERNRARQRHSCGQNDFHKCLGDCVCCPWNCEGTATAIISFHLDYFESLASAEDVEKTVFQRLIIAKIYAYADQVVSHGAELLFKHFEEQKSLRDIAQEMNLSLTVVARRLKQLIRLIRSNRAKFFEVCTKSCFFAV